MFQNRIISLLIGLSITGLLFSQTSYYVSPTGNDSNTGTIDLPLQTIQTAVNKMADGDIVYIREGVYREKIETQKNNIVIRAYPGEKPVLKGSDLMTSWEACGSYWKKFVTVQPQQVFVNGNNPLQQIGWPWPESVNLSSAKKYQNPVGENLNDMAPGRFFWQNDTLYIYLEDSSNPNSHEIEVSQREQVLIIRNANGIYVNGLQIEHSNANTYREQGSAIYLGTECVLDSCLIQWCDFGGVSMGNRSQVVNSTAIHNGAVGLQTSGTADFIIQNTRMAYNNYRNFYSQWHTGGFKGATHAWGTVENCEVDHNNGPGIWFDYCHYSARNDANDGDNLYPIIIRNNYIHDNGTGSYDTHGINNNASILIEVSEQAYVYNNIIDNYEYRGIWVSSAWKSYFVNNIVANGKSGSSYAIDGGASYVDWAWVKEDIIANNILYNNNTTYDIRMMPDDGGTKYFNNLCQNNLIYRNGGNIAMRYGSTTKSSLEAWQNNTPFGQNSISADPMFSDDQFHLSNESPCINTGFNLLEDTMLIDFENNDRIIGDIIDMGPFEASIGGTGDYDASLVNLNVDNGYMEPQFSSTIYMYVDTLPDNTTQTPTVSPTPACAGSNITISDATNVMSDVEAERTTVITVVSESGTISKEYRIMFYSKKIIGVNNTPDNSFRLYPNPSNGMIYIENYLAKKEVSIKVLNITGKEINVISFNNFGGKKQLDLSNQPDGFYFLLINTDRKSNSYKVMIRK